uniref:glucan endo-1,3-beta-D-glucosidase n=1 Tax=Aegilops tauschii TaxID=37682 RepID=M8AXT2_AEGTA
MARTGLPARDLRVLDPLLSYPSTILGRERAIVVNLERVKAVITAAEVLLPNSKDPDFARFVRDLQARVLTSADQAAEFTDMDGESSAIASPFPAPSSSKGHELEMAKRTPNAVGEMTHSSSVPTLTAMKDGSTKVLPFEFRALEVCLESACRSLEEEIAGIMLSVEAVRKLTVTLEKEAYPALDELTSKISTLNLERVRQIKSRLVAISGRVQKVRDELEHLLDDEMDMAEMYLTEKLAREDISETSSRVEVDDHDHDHDPSQLEEDMDEDYRSEPAGTASNGSFIGYKPNIEELEMLLEAYFVQIDGTLNKLSHLREYVDDTEDYINIMLDDKQNQLLQMGVMLSTATVVITAGVAVVGLFGMNIGISLYTPVGEEQTRAAHVKFWETTFGTIAGCTILSTALGFMDGVDEAAAATSSGVSLLLLCPRCCGVVSDVMVEQGGFVVQEYAQAVVYASDSWKMEYLVLGLWSKAGSSGFLLRRRRHARVSVLKFDGVPGDMLPRSDSFNGYGFAFGKLLWRSVKLLISDGAASSLGEENFALNDGDQPEYIHPYLLKSAAAGLKVCYPKSVHSPSFHAQAFVADLTVSSPSDAAAAAAAGAGWRHIIAGFDDLSVTLDFSRSLRAFLVRGSPFVTVSTMCARRPVDISIASVHAFLEAAPRDDSLTRRRLRMNRGQTVLLYASAPIRLSMSSVTQLAAPGFLGVIRVAFLPDAAMEAVLDRYSGRYPTAGVAALDRPFSVDYGCRVRVLEDFRYRSIDGDLVGVVGDAWALRTDPVFPTWHSTRGISEDGVPEIVAALRKDVDDLASSAITTTSSYFYGKAVARAARLALIAEEVGCPDVIPAVHGFLNATVTPWLDGSFEGNGFLYDPKWGGLVTRQGMTDTGADFGFGIYNDHHYHLGYFVYAIAVLAKIDPAWGREYMPQACFMVADFMTLSPGAGASYTRLRTFDLWKLHSWAGGLTEFGDGRNQESTSEAVNAYYSAALLGLSYGDTQLVSAAATLTALEMLAAQTWWHIREGDAIYEDDFTGNNRVVGIVWANKRDSGLCEVLFPDAGFVKELVSWTAPALARDGVGDGWKGVGYAAAAVDAAGGTAHGMLLDMLAAEESLASA